MHPLLVHTSLQGPKTTERTHKPLMNTFDLHTFLSPVFTFTMMVFMNSMDITHHTVPSFSCGGSVLCGRWLVMWDWKNMCGPSVLSGIGMYWGLDLIQGWWSTEPVWQVKDCRLGQGRDGVVVSQGTAASQELCVEEEWVEKLEREVHSNESCLGGSVRWRSDGKWTWGTVVQVTVQACKRVFHSVSDLNTFLR